MSVKKVDLTVSQLINDLNEGLTWLKRDDLGYGSIEAKYGANEKQIAAIKKHPALKDAETNIIIFNIIDDTKSKSAANQKNEQNMVGMVNKQKEMATNMHEAADVFSNL